MNKTLFKVLLLSACFALLTGCGSNGETEKTDTTPISQETETPDAAEAWYELDADAGTLTVRLPDAKQGFDWAFLISDESVLELLTQESNDGTFTASFRALSDGDAQITFSYIRNDELDEARVMEVHCEGGKITAVNSAGVVDMNGSPEDDERVTEVRDANSIMMLLREHTAVTCVSENWDGAEQWQYSSVRQFTYNDGRLWFDYEQSDESGEVVDCQAGYVNSDVPGAYYTSNAEGMKYMEIYLPSEYEAFLGDHWLNRSEGDYEVVVSEETTEEYDNTTLSTRRVNDTTGVYADVDYYIETSTGLISAMEVTEYNPEDGSPVSITRSNFLYDEPRALQERAAFDVLSAADTCALTVVVNPGEDNEETLNYNVAKSTEVEFNALEGFSLFSDEACTQPMDWIDVNQDQLTVYVKLNFDEN